MPPDAEATLIVSNSEGKVLQSFPLSSKENSIALDLGSWPAGIYFYSLQVDGAVVAGKRMNVVR